MFFQEFFILHKQILFPDMETEPGSPHHPVACRDAYILGCGITPDICVMVGHEATTAIHCFCRLCSAFPHILNHSNQRFITLRQVTGKGWPVVHLRIDIDGIFTAPGRCILIVPNPLQIIGQRSGSASCNHQITAELKKADHIFIAFDFQCHTIV